MQEAFGIVLFVVVFLAAIAAAIAFFGSSSAYREIGRGGLSLNEDRPRADPRPVATRTAERDDEIRQFLAARNERRARRGQAPLDVEEELARITAPAVDAGLRGEVRDLVVARNERRVRQGKEPLDIEAEVERQLRDLTG
jgi:flagellar basal body-associated protein FliL